MYRYRRLIPYLQPLLPKSPSPSYPTSVAPFINTLCLRTFTTSPQPRSTNFDTLKVVERLQKEGFTPEQSQAVMQLLKDVIDESTLGLTRTMVTREEQDKVRTHDQSY
jgi:Protein of unknown function (DUF1640)